MSSEGRNGRPESAFFRRWTLIVGCDLKPQEKLVLLIVSKYQGENESTWASRARMRADAGLSDGQFRKWMRGLVQAGLIGTRWSGRGWTAHTWIVEEAIRDRRDSADQDRRTPADHDGDDRRGTTARKNKRKNSGKEHGEPFGGVDVPRVLDCPRFRTAWSQWLAYRRESRLPSWKPVTIQKQLRQLAEAGLDLAINAIETSITNGWHGLFPKSGHSNSARRTPSIGDSPYGNLPTK